MLKSSIAVKDEVKCKASEDFYGIFFEDINRAGDGGIYPEMLRNRSFEDSIPPKDVEMFGKDNAVFVNRGGWPDVFNHGEGIPRWTKDLPYTPIPAWYVDGGEIKLSPDVLNSHREATLSVTLTDGEKTAVRRWMRHCLNAKCTFADLARLMPRFFYCHCEAR